MATKKKSKKPDIRRTSIPLTFTFTKAHEKLLRAKLRALKARGYVPLSMSSVVRLAVDQLDVRRVKIVLPAASEKPRARSK